MHGTRLRILPILLLPVLIAGPGAPASADDFREEQVSFTTHDGLAIQCILSAPDQPDGRFPGMLLLAGSGLHDADLTVDEPTLGITQGRQTLFRPLARQFSRAGWAVLRCNKRGASFQHRDDRPHLLQTASFEDLIEDARSALQTLHGHPRVLASPLVVLGHSEGAAIASRLAEQSPAIDLLVLVGSTARSAGALLEYQLVDRNLQFLRQAADANGDGALTLDELNALDGKSGLGSVYVFNSAAILFQQVPTEDGTLAVQRFNPSTDANNDGRLDIDGEIEPRMRSEVDRFLTLARRGALGRYWQSSLEAEPLVATIQRHETPILFVHGELDVQTPIDEPLALIARLESLGNSSYDLLVFPGVGHSLSEPNDFFAGDEGLSLLDNLTFNAPSSRVRRRLLHRIEAILAR
jgi:pimeloyl-ACP methyl ester carboxylesterase